MTNKVASLEEKNYPRTTLFIIEKEDWVNAKGIAEMLGYDSVSKYIFDLLKADREHKISYHSLFLELEKYYELEHYTLGLAADRAGFPERILINLMQKFELPFPEEKKIENTRPIHELLLQYRLVPREVDSILRLRTESLKRQSLSDADILYSVFPDNLERTAEVLTLTRDGVFRLLEKYTLEKLCKSCKAVVERHERYSNLKSLFGRFGLEYDDEALDNDPLIKNLRKENCVQLFGQMLEYASLSLIKRELERIEIFQSDQVMTIKLKELEEDKERIIKRREEIKKELPYVAASHL